MCLLYVPRKQSVANTKPDGSAIYDIVYDLANTLRLPWSVPSYQLPTNVGANSNVSTGWRNTGSSSKLNGYTRTYLRDNILLVKKTGGTAFELTTGQVTPAQKTPSRSGL